MELQLQLQKQLEGPNSENMKWKLNSSDLRKNLLSMLTKGLVKEKHPNADFVAKYYEHKAFNEAKVLSEYKSNLLSHLEFISKKQEEEHSLIRGVVRQSCSARAKNFTKGVFYHVQFSGIIQNIAYHRAIKTKF